MEIAAIEGVTSWRKKVLHPLIASLGPEDLRSDPKVIYESHSLSAITTILPSFFVRDTGKAIEMMTKGTMAKGLEGYEFHRAGAVVVIRYALTPIAYLLPRRDEMVSTIDQGETLSPKYYLPRIYWLMERGRSDPALVSLEASIWDSLPPTSVPYSSGGRGKERMNRETIYTGMTAACLMLGLSISLPLETVVKSHLSSSPSSPSHLDGGDRGGDRGGGGEVRQFGVGHPSGIWYINVRQTVAERALLEMSYDTLAYEATDLYRMDGYLITSPRFTLAQLMIDEWLLERRGIERWKMVHWVASELRSKPPPLNAPETRVGYTRDWSNSLHRRGWR